MEACGSAHHWARKLQELRPHVRLMAPQFVKPYVKTNKNDAADAEAICEAVGAAEHALRADQERRAAGGPGAAPGAPGLREGAHRAGQSDPRPAWRVRPDHAAGIAHIAKRVPSCSKMRATSCRARSGS